MSTLLLTLVDKAVIAQDQRDSRILDLLGIMNEVYTLVLDAEPLKKIKSQKQAIEMLAKQTTDCAHFVSLYFNDANFCEPLRLFQTQIVTTLSGSRLGKNIMGGVDSKITGFENVFKSLRATFAEGVALNTELFVVRMMSDVETIGKLQIQSNLHFIPYSCHSSCRSLVE